MHLNLIQVAESFGVSEKTVLGWVRLEGLPCLQDRGRWVFDRAEVAQWAATRGLAGKTGFLAPSEEVLPSAGGLSAFLYRGGIHRDIAPAALPDLLESLLLSLPGLPPPAARMLAARMNAPGGLSIAPVGRGFALPHPAARIALGRDAGTLALILLNAPLSFPEPRVDPVPVTRLLFFVAPSARAHIDVLARLSRFLLSGALSECLDHGAGDAAVLELFQQEDEARQGPEAAP